MIDALTLRQTQMIAKNVSDIIKSDNIEKLTKQSYNFLYLCQGFIAHYNIGGFKDYYENTSKLQRDLLLNESMNQWSNFQKGNKDYEYYMSKKRTYNTILEHLI